MLVMRNGSVVADLPRALMYDQMKPTAGMPVSVAKASCADSNDDIIHLPIDTPEGSVLRVCAYPGKVTGLYCAAPQKHRWYSEQIFSGAGLRYSDAVIITKEQLVKGYFPDLSVTENLLMAAVERLSGRERLRVRKFHRFIVEECKDLLPIPPARWHEPMRHFGKREIEQVILYRQLLRPARVIVLAGVLESADQDTYTRFLPFLRHACARKKAVVLFGRSCAGLENLCAQIQEL